MTVSVYGSVAKLEEQFGQRGISLSRTQAQTAWWHALSEAFGHSFFGLLADSSNSDGCACLPLMHVKSPLFGGFLVSLPYLNTAGVFVLESSILNDSQEGSSRLGTDAQLSNALVDRAVALADELDVQYLELRQEVRLEHRAFNLERTDKVHMRMPLPKDASELLKSFKSKLRSQIKKAGENEFEVKFGHQELLDDFYDVFAENMRDLGTPVYSVGLFRKVLEHFEKESAEICVVRLGKHPVAGGLLVHQNGRTEVPSASSLRRWNSTNANMWMYWAMLQRSIEKSSLEFDFGRSTVGGGTYKFKEQWGASPHPAVWQYYVRKGDPGRMRPDSNSNKRLVQTWKKLPIWFTKWVGPWIVRGIP